MMYITREYTVKAEQLIKGLADAQHELDDLKSWHDQAREDEKAGPIERKFLLYLQQEIGMVSKCWHGGDYEGNGVFAFLGKFGYGKKTEKRRTYKDAIAKLKKILRDMMTDLTWTNRGFEYLVKRSIFVTLDWAISPLLDRLKVVADYLMKNRKLTESEIQEGNKNCVEYVHFFRQTFVNCSEEHKAIIGQVNIRPKHHLLESHVPPFALKWRSIGLFSESAIETYHKDTNKLQTRWKSVQRAEQYLRLCDDNDNQQFLMAAQTKGRPTEKVAASASKKRKRE